MKKDVYYDPEDFGLKQVADLSDPNEFYDFDYLIVWKHEDGRLFWARDSGCSCPSPFENHTSLESLTEITPASFPEFEQSVMEHCDTIENKHKMLRIVKEFR